MKRKITIALIALFSIAAIATFADARQGKRGQRGGNRMMHSKVMSELNLTDAQQEKLKSLRTTHQKEMVKLQATSKLAQIELKEVLGQDNPKTADVKTKIAASNAARNKVSEARIMNRLETKKVFTAEQLKKMEELRSQRGGRKGMREGRKGRRGQRQFQGRQFRGHRGGGSGMMPGDFETTPQVEEPAAKM